MNSAEVEKASKAILELVIEQGEKRLVAQCEFAGAQDDRGSLVVNAGSAMAAASAAIAAASAGAEGLLDPLTAGTAVATIGFSLAAGLAMWALRSAGFHSCGFFPEDFLPDIRSGKSEHRIRVDLALELQLRLSHNAAGLHTRGSRSNWAIICLLMTPAVALGTALLVANESLLAAWR